MLDAPPEGDQDRAEICIEESKAVMPIQIDQLSLGMLQANCYIVGSSDSGDAIIIDPCDQADLILAQIEKRGYQVRQIVATHAHFDHVIASYAVKQATGAPFRLHHDEAIRLREMPQRAALFGIRVKELPAEPDGFLQHGDLIEVDGIRLEARFTPGHSEGHLTFVMAEHKVAFVGDCIFYDGIGRTDLPGGDARTLKKSITEQILTLPDDFTLCPGHGPITTVGRERRENPFLAQLLQV